MINRQEVMTLAGEFGLAPQVIEKDYVLGWLLAGISAQPELAANWVFKGGTCLKKCYFETYRFSEDLDFTLTDATQLEPAFLTQTFTEVAAWIYEQSGIEIPAEMLRFVRYDNPRGNPSAQGRVSYRGPLGRGGDLPRIKLDLTYDEVLVLVPALRDVHHPYSDLPEEGIKTRCYSFEEVFAEKIRALAERSRPRDLYDVIHLFRHDELRPDRQVLFDTLVQKCVFKGIDIPTLQTLQIPHIQTELRADWGNMLAHQLQALPAFEQFWQELPELFDWLHGTYQKPARPVIGTANIRADSIDMAWRPPAMSYAWGTGVPLESIRFAAANRLCVNLDYDGTTRLIEPYSLRRTKENNLLLCAVKHDTGESRTYRVDRIRGARVSDISYSPRFAIELTPAGEFIPLKSVTTTSSSRPVPGIARQKQPRQATVYFKPHNGPTYVYKCPFCKKTFNRKTMDAKLNTHKGTYGLPCIGTMGTFVRKKY